MRIRKNKQFNDVDYVFVILIHSGLDFQILGYCVHKYRYRFCYTKIETIVNFHNIYKILGRRECTDFGILCDLSDDTLHILVSQKIKNF